MFKRKNFILCLFFIIILVLNLTGFAASEQKYGGTLRFAMSDNPSSLDVQITTSDIDSIIAQHLFEGLYTFNSKYEPVPHLVESSEVQNDGKLVVLHLREGVLFHNGKEMTAEDVVSSLNRWGEYGGRGPVLFKYVEKVEAADKYTVNIYFNTAFGSWKTLFSFLNGGPTILPKEIMDNAGAEPIKPENFIGTGPYKFKEWVQGRSITIERFDGYSARDEDPDGYAGKRVAYFDEIIFTPVNDPVTRINGVKAGDYDWGWQIPGDFYDELKKDPSVVTVVRGAPSFGEMFFNSKKGIMKDNYKLREALATAIDFESVNMAAIGNKDLWGLTGSIFPPGMAYYSEKGIEKYNRNDVELARQLAKEAGYNGEQIRIMYSQAYQSHYNACTVMAPMLEAAGFNVDFQLYDWATLVARRGDEDLWDIFYTHHGFVPDPNLYTFLSTVYPGWWNTDKRSELVAKLDKSSDIKERVELWGEIQALMYEQWPIIKVGDMYTYDIASPKIQGQSVEPGSLIYHTHFWNSWFE